MENEFATTWTKDELKTYLLIYSANADFSEKKIEREFIKTRTNSENFDKIHDEFDGDNDFISIRKLGLAFERHNYTNADVKKVLSEVKALFKVDGEFDLLEENLLRGLKLVFIK